MVSFKTRWAVLDVVLFFALLLAFMGLTSIYAQQIKEIFSGYKVLGMEPKIALFFFSALLQSVFMIVLFSLMAWLKKLSLRELDLGFSGLVKNLSTGVGGGIVLFIIVMILGAVITALSPKLPPPQEVATYLLAMEGLVPRLLAFFLGSIMAPLSEELIFRGMVFPVFREKLGRNAAIVLSGLFFSLAHRDLFRLIPIAVGGMGLAYLYDRTRSLWTSIIAHATWNAVMFLLMVYAAKIVP